MVRYSISKHKQLGKYVLWAENKSSHGFCIKGIFQGTKQECEEKLKEIKGGENNE